jgi:DNA adenine methylase
MTRYVEPFVGGGAVFFGLKGSAPVLKWVGGKRKLYPQVLDCLGIQEFTEFYLADFNKDLVAKYSCLQQDVEAVIAQLSAWPQTEAEYYRLRAVEPQSQVERAARMLYLNLHCFNGLWRTNAAGKMNAPYGGKAPTRPDVRTYNMVDFAERLRAAAKVLQDVTVVCSDFSMTLAQCGAGDVVYCDPPYLPDTTSAFIAYTKSASSPLVMHERLAQDVAAAVTRGARIVISNSPAAAPLYHEWCGKAGHSVVVKTISSQRSIGVGKGSEVKRRQDEVLVIVSKE